jgi:hypothetical protein
VYVKLTSHWNCWKPGRVFSEMGDGPANLLIKRGIAVEVDAVGRPKHQAASDETNEGKNHKAAKKRR